MDKTQFHAGVNLGGWLSQYPAYDLDHFGSFITEADIRRIADWGCDHVRLPVDYPLLEVENEPGMVNPEGMAFLQRGLNWCKQNGLNVILDLHKAPGFSFNDLQAATLFDNPAQQIRFLTLWERLARSMKGSADFVAFELLNEIVLPESAPWNALAQKTVECIRRIDPDRVIVLGGNYFNSASQLANLVYLDDPNILYTFHFYEPLVVTHQKAKWVPELMNYNETTEYPGLAPTLPLSVVSRPGSLDYLNRYAGQYLDRSILLADVQPAIDFCRAHDTTAYCGEFGVIDLAPARTRLNWTRDFISILEEYHLGRAYWSYKGVDFGLVDLTGKVVDEELVKIVCAH